MLLTENEKKCWHLRVVPYGDCFFVQNDRTNVLTSIPCSSLESAAKKLMVQAQAIILERNLSQGLIPGFSANRVSALRFKDAVSYSPDGKQIFIRTPVNVNITLTDKKGFYYVNEHVVSFMLWCAQNNLNPEYKG